eukprot:1816084-Pyramimonas_sp.AAC.1
MTVRTETARRASDQLRFRRAPDLIRHRQVSLRHLRHVLREFGWENDRLLAPVVQHPTLVGALHQLL